MRYVFQKDYLEHHDWASILKERAESSSKLFVLCLRSIPRTLKQLFCFKQLFQLYTYFLWRRFTDFFILLLECWKSRHSWLLQLSFQYFSPLSSFWLAFTHFLSPTISIGKLHAVFLFVKWLIYFIMHTHQSLNWSTSQSFSWRKDFTKFKFQSPLYHCIFKF